MYSKKGKKMTMVSPNLSIPQENLTPAQIRSIFSPGKISKQQKGAVY
jgi:hypothetical protein